MDSDEGKLFIGGIAWDTSEETLTEYFTQYGQVTQAVIMREKPTGRPRGFGFVVFSDPSVLDRVLQDRHTIDGRTVSPFPPSICIHFLVSIFGFQLFFAYGFWFFFFPFFFWVGLKFWFWVVLVFGFFFGLALSFDFELFWFLGFAFFFLGCQVQWLVIFELLCRFCWIVVIFNGFCLYSSVCACGHWFCPLRFLKYAENHENNRV